MSADCPGHETPLVPEGEPGLWAAAWPEEDIAGWGWCPSCPGWWKPGAPGRVSYREARSRPWGDAARGGPGPVSSGV